MIKSGLAALLVALMLMGCGEEECDVDLHCPAALRCEDHRCVPYSCLSNQDCPRGSACVAMTCSESLGAE